MLYSTGADEDVAMAMQRVSDDERAIYNEHSSRISQLLTAQTNDIQQANVALMGLYGQDIQYALANPPPPPAPSTQKAVEKEGSGPAPAKAPVHLSYKEFVDKHGGKSTGRLARLWDKRFNDGQRFGQEASPNNPHNTRRV